MKFFHKWQHFTFVFSGSIYDLTGSYDLPFFIAGVLLVLSSIVSFMVPLVAKISKNNNSSQNPGVVRDQEMMSEDQESVV